MVRLIPLVYFFTLIQNVVWAEIICNPYFSDHMVFQRGHPITIWGKGEPLETVKVRINGTQKEFQVAKDSSWSVSFPEIPSGEPFDIEFTGNTYKKMIRNAVLGDVWLCGGQSNMEWTIQQCKGLYDSLMRRVNQTQIRLIKVKNMSSSYPLASIQSEKGWQMAKYPEVMEFSAVAYFFASELIKSSDVPIGLLSANWSGSPAEAWMSPTSLAAFPEIFQEYAKQNQKRQTRIVAQNVRNKNLKKWIQEAIASDSLTQQSVFLASDTLQTQSWLRSLKPQKLSELNLSTFDGVVWYKHVFEWKQKESDSYTLHLGKIDDMDEVWINGKWVGSTDGYNMDRMYKIKDGILKKGTNVMYVRVVDYGGEGGWQTDSIFIRSASKTYGLEGNWYSKPGYNLYRNAEYIAPDYTIQYGSWDPSGLYHGMIAPLQKFPIKGVIWYQGESNASRAYQYRKLFPALINDWRAYWQSGNFPFYFVQLANFLTPDEFPKTDPWPELREAQQMALSIPNTGMAVAIDLGEADDIHPSRKKEVGERLAYIAANQVYLKNIPYKGPMYTGFKVEGNAIRVYFDLGNIPLVSRGGVPQEFVIAGADKKFYRAKAVIEKNTVIVSHPKVPAPVAVRYAWANNPHKANMYNAVGLPMAPFRTDTWQGCTFGKYELE